MSTPPLPIDEFAKRLRTKYPGAYDSLSDSQLVQKVVDKYPDYKQHIASMAPTQAEQQPERSVTDAYDPKAEGTTQRFLGSAGAALLSVPGAILKTGMDPVGTAKDIVSSVGNAAKTYANSATRPTLEGIKSVLPEALGTGFGNAAAAYTPEAAYGAKDLTATALRSPDNQVRAPVKALAAAGKLFGGPELADAFIPNRPPAPLGSPYNPGPMSKIPNRLPASLRGDPFVPKAAPAPEPELGSPENPGFMSKLPARLPPNLRGDPFAPKVEETAEAGRQADAASEPNPNSVAVVPEPRAPLPSDRPGSAWSLTRTKGLPEAAQRGQPGAADVLRQVGQPVVMTSRGGDIESPNMQALRESLGITQSAPDPYASQAPEMPQGNPTPFGPSVTQSWLKPRKQVVLQ